MISKLLNKSSLFRLLLRIEIDLAEQVQKSGCPYCNGPLHQAYYERKPRGGPEDIPKECLTRRSLCCGNENCRRRTLPPSVLFMDRRVYWANVILILLTLRQGRESGSSFARLERLFEICPQTIKRWINYFRDEFPQSQIWQRLRGRLVSTVSNFKLPASLLLHFQAHSSSTEKALINCLRFLATGSCDI